MQACTSNRRYVHLLRFPFGRSPRLRRRAMEAMYPASVPVASAHVVVAFVRRALVCGGSGSASGGQLSAPRPTSTLRIHWIHSVPLQMFTTARSRHTSLPKAIDACLAALHAQSPPVPSAQLVPKAAVVLVANPTAAAPAADLLRLPALLRASTAAHPLPPGGIPTIGAVVSAIAPDAGPGVSVSYLYDIDSSNLASRTPTRVVRPFWVRPAPPLSSARRKGVGRWPEMGARGRLGVREDAGDGGEAFRAAGFSLGDDSASKSPSGEAFGLPEELKAASLCQGDLILSFTDREPNSFLSALDSKFPLATKMGLIGTMTPFSTGQPHTLLINDQLVFGGAVGLAISSPSLHESIQHPQLTHHGVVKLGDPLTVTKCKGNVVLSLDDTAASKSLLAVVRHITAQTQSDRTLYVEVQLDEGQAPVVFRVASGDPSKGAIAVETQRELKAGMRVQFLSGTTSATVAQRKGPHLQFAVCHPDHPGPQTPVNDSNEDPEVHLTSTISAWSNQGVLFGAPGGRTDVCDVTYAEAFVGV
ncbi:hypothetical protein DFJ73DRAFT_119517 [Zopfochytrium polystomum]|nr:hypothetical protein DFJ73DRAFT_119517 [Zopfochytrium polystomum]